MDEERVSDYGNIFRLSVEAAVEINACLMGDSLTKTIAVNLLSRSLGEYAKKIREEGIDPVYDEIFRSVIENYSEVAIPSNGGVFAGRIESVAIGLDGVVELPKNEQDRLIGLCCDLSDLAKNVNFKKNDHSEEDVA